MPKPKQINALRIYYNNGANSEFLKVSSLDLKSGIKKYYIDVPKQSLIPSIYNAVLNANYTLKNKSFIDTIVFKGDKLEFTLTPGSSSSENIILVAIRDEIQGEVKVYESKNIQTTTPTPTAPQGMVYSFTEKDIDDLGVGDVIIFERLNDTNAKITITEVKKSGQDFIAITEYQTAPDAPIITKNDDTISRPFLLKLKNEQRVRDFKKAKQSFANQSSYEFSSLNLMSEQDIDDLEVGDVILQYKEDAKPVKMSVKEVKKRGQEFIIDSEYEDTFNNLPIYNKGELLKRDDLSFMINEWGNIYLEKANNLYINQVSKPSSMQDIRVDEFIGKLNWSSGLKLSMIKDFDASGYQTFRDLVKDNIANTSREIQSKIQGFSSGKNTYLQAGTIAEKLFEYATSEGIPNIPPTKLKKFIGWDELTLPKSGIVVYKNIRSGEKKILLDPTYLDDAGGILQDALNTFLTNSELVEEYEESQESFVWTFNNRITVSTLEEFYDELDNILVDFSHSPTNAPSQPTISSQPNLGEPIYGFIIKGSFTGEFVQIIEPSNVKIYEIDYYYEVKFMGQGGNIVIPRENFMVVGDVIRVSFYRGSQLDAKILVLQNDTTIKIDAKVSGIENWNIGGFDWENDVIRVLEYYNLHEIFESNNQTLTQPPPPPPTIINQYEAELNQAKKDVAQLMFLRSVVSPIDFEQKIQIGQLLSEKQKGVNDLNFKIVEKKLSSGNIFDDLFEQSFTPIKNVYDDVYVSPNEPVDFFAPNGDRSKLSDALNEVIRTPQFMEWFGNWELAYLYKDTDDFEYKCSQVVSESGEPLLVWHGTGQAFSYFKFDTFPAAYFAVNKAYSEWFADLHGGGQGYTIPFFLNVRNPLDLTYFHLKKVTPNDFFAFIYLKTGMDMDELEVNPIFKEPNYPANETWVYLRNNPKMLKKISDMNLYDGIHFYETNPGVPPTESAYSTEVYITFTAQQAKIADSNRGLLLLSSLKSFLLEKGGKI